MCLPIIDIEASCKNLKRLCKDRGYSATDLQKALGLESCQACYKWFSGKNLPSIDNLLVISYLLDVTLEEILVTKNVNVQKRDY